MVNISIWSIMAMTQLKGLIYLIHYSHFIYIYTYIYIILSTSFLVITNDWYITMGTPPTWRNYDVFSHNAKTLNFLTWKQRYHCVSWVLVNMVNRPGPLLLTWFKFNPSIDMYIFINCKGWDKNSYPFSNFNSCTMKAWEYISNCYSNHSDRVVDCLVNMITCVSRNDTISRVVACSCIFVSHLWVASCAPMSFVNGILSFNFNISRIIENSNWSLKIILLPT